MHKHMQGLRKPITRMHKDMHRVSNIHTYIYTQAHARLTEAKIFEVRNNIVRGSEVLHSPLG